MGQNCGREWTREYMVKQLKKTWVYNQYKTHRENIIYDQERALLPATQPVAQAKIEYKKLRKDLYEIDMQLKRLKQERINTHENMINALHRSNNIEAAQPGERRAFIKRCPVDDCLGYLSTQWKCGICNTWACPDCHVSKGLDRNEPHVCDPNTLATARLLAQDTKSCPKCHIDIYKIDGCNQMWCVYCHTAFDWSTLRIDTGVVHNPHYFQYMRETNNGVVPRNPLDNPNQLENPCERRVLTLNRIRIIAEVFSSVKGVDTEETYNNIVAITRNLLHIIHYEMPNMRVNHENRNLNLRVSYLCQEISEHDFKTQLQRREKLFEKKRAIYQIFEVCTNVASDIIMDYITKCNDEKNKGLNMSSRLNITSIMSVRILHSLLDEWNKNCISQINAILKYSNECLEKIAYTFGSKKLIINEQFRIVH
jgi:hypothetical protein